MTLPRVEPGENADETRQAVFLLENIQQAYWVGQSGALELSIPARYYVEADVSPHLGERLSPALRRIIQRHEMLRAIIRPSGEQQILNDVPPYEIHVQDLRGLADDDRERRLKAVREATCSRELPVEIWPQFDIRATRLDTVLRLHIRFALWMIDGWSFHLFVRELLTLSADPDAQLPAPEMSFADYVEAQKQARLGLRREKAWEYWQPRIADFPGPPSLPLTRRLKLGECPRFVRASRSVPASVWGRIVEACSKARITPSLLACAVYAEILARYSGTHHFAITILYSGRFSYLPRSANVFGNFGTTILLEIDASRERSFLDRVRGIQRQFWRDAERIEVSGLDVARALQQRSGTGPGVSIPVTFTALTSPTQAGGAEPPPALIHHATGHLQVPQVYLDHQMHVGEDGSVVFIWDYVDQIFPSGFVGELSGAHHDLILRLAESESLWHEADPKPRGNLVPEPVRLRAVPADRLETAFERQAIHRPDHVAIIAGERWMSYAELRRRSRVLSSG